MRREKIEWCQMYWYDTDRPELPRVLLIGDSIVVGERDLLAKALEGRAAVAAFSTSKIVGDPAFGRELDFALGDYPPDLIVFNYGLHGREYDDGFYRRGLEGALDHLRGILAVPILWRNSTPITVAGHPEQFHPQDNDLVLRRNRIAAEVVVARGIPSIDLYAPMAAHPEYSRGDGYHYTPEGYAAQVAVLAPRILEALGLR